MSYTVFALKWRPGNFDEIIGQGHIVTTLKSALEKNRLAHAYLFAGPRGVGKTSTARILAKALNCKHGPTINPCQKCSSCIEISQGRAFDVIEIDGASNRGIDEIRALRESVKFAPAAGKFKIYIIDEVHMLTTEAFNALLKTLEEPPEFVKFIFATTHAHKVIPTVLSRCQRFDFRRIPIVEIIAQLEKILASENIDVDKDVLFAIAKASDGALRDAESVLDQLVSFSRDNISLQDVLAVLGVVEQDLLFEITDKIIQKDALNVLALLNKVIEQGKDIGVFLNSLIEHFRNLMVAMITQADSKLLDLPEEICQRLLQQSKKISLEEIFAAFNILVNAQEMSKRLESQRIPLEISLVKLTQAKKNPRAESIEDKPSAGIDNCPPIGEAGSPVRFAAKPGVGKACLSKGEAGLSAGKADKTNETRINMNVPVSSRDSVFPVSGVGKKPNEHKCIRENPPKISGTCPEAGRREEELNFRTETCLSDSARPSAAIGIKESIDYSLVSRESAIEIALEDIKLVWQKIIASLSKIKISVATYLNEGRPIKVEKNILTVAFPKNHSLHKEALETKENKALLEKIFRELFNVHLRVNFILTQENADSNNTDNPLVKSALETFNGRVIREENGGLY
ncbi:MAG: DNA polymerase III subunit gamma/tau [Candidatus Omnitrophota bacterium]